METILNKESRAAIELMVADGIIAKDTAERYFPELKESEDERMMNQLHSWMKEFGGAEEYTEKVYQWIKGLIEKQGEHAKFCDSIQVGDKVIRNQDGVLVNLSQLKRVAKPADEVEPKFHKGEWITNGDYTWKIVEVKHLDYILQSQDGNIVDDTISHVDEQFHSFTIEDAKDGDVLCTYECDEPKIVFILKGIPKKHYALSYYCYYDIMYPHFAFDSVKGCLAPDDEDVKPATKEQCDLLFQNMKEVGYKWDAEKKELNRINKIEQKPAWSEENSCYYDDICEILINLINSPKSKVNKDAIQKDLDWLMSIGKSQLKPVWSEEDVKMIGTLVAIFEVNYPDGFYKVNPIGTTNMQGIHSSEIIKWLKYLKERVLPQPKQEWSEEDEQLYNDLSDTYFYNDEDYPEETYKRMLKKVLDWMNKRAKSLRPQSHWKPSDEQMDGLLWYLNNTDKNSLSYDDIESLYNDLKKLKE